ncbi:LysR substrate-binding domain-containing protein [Carnimonas nigrificans]|uniref:LysR substrate-binding domain-containing protein n=1 Tax=Carnimonas nigrificans TaxID=64323 RepID=UPI00068405A5|nr:LysR substrate-binding domain-containing protein [Carnimonas nigrificans]
MKPVQRPLDLILLNSYVSVIDNEGFSAAGNALNLAQSTMSAHIKRLEEQLGHALLIRGTRIPRPTPAGERLLMHARQMLKQSALAWLDIQEQRLDGVIRLGIPDDYLVYLPRVLAHFEARFPDVELEVKCALSVDLVQKISRGHLDLAIITRQPFTPGGEVLLREKTIWVGAQGFAIQLDKPLPLALAAEGTCIFRERAIAALDAAGIAWRIAYESSSLIGLTRAVAAGLAVTVMTPTMLEQGLRVVEDNTGVTGGFPALPDTEIALLRAEHRLNDACRQLANELQRRLQVPLGGVPATEQYREGWGD